MKDEKKNGCCNKKISDLIFETNINHTFCEKCGTIILKGPTGNIYYTLKNKQKKGPIEFNPIEIIKSMKKRTEKDYPFLSEEYNINNNDKSTKDKINNSINLYLKHREFIILSLQKIMDIFDYSDYIFYQCLFYLDIYLSHNMKEDTSDKEILCYVVSFFIISAKTKETDIFEPNLESFLYMKKDAYLTKKEIVQYEVICLKTIKYNIYNYSAYDWISELSYIGFVFDCEVNKDNEKILINGHRHLIVNTIYKYVMKLLLDITIKNIFIKYSPIYIAFSLIQISRKKFLDNNHINNNLYNSLINLFGVYFEDYKKCYEELKKELIEKEESNDIIVTSYNKQKNNKNNNILPSGSNIQNYSNKDNNDSIKNLITYYKTSNDNENIKKLKKVKSNIGLINLKEVLIKEENINTKTENIINSNDSIKNKDENCKNDSNLFKGEKCIISSNSFKNEKCINNSNSFKDKKCINNSNSFKDEKSINNSNSFKDVTNNNNLKNKIDDSIDNNDNIIFYNEKNEEKKNEMIIPKIEYLKTEVPITRKKNTKKMKLQSLTNTKNRNHLSINFNNNNINLYQSNELLPKINRFFNQKFTSQKKSKDSKSKYNITITNSFLKSNHIPVNLKYINTRSLNMTDKKKYLLTANNNRKKNYIPKEKLNSMKKSLFSDNLNKNNSMKKSGIDFFRITNIKLSNLIPKISYFESLLNGKNFYKIKDKNVNNKTRNKSCVKEKAIDSVAWKETRLYIANKRNKSNKQIKRKNIKNIVNINNTINNNNIYKIKLKK